MIKITDAALSELKIVWADQKLPEDAMLTLAIRGGGCSGFQWVLNITEASDIDPAKYIIEDVSGIKVAVDKRSAMYVEGTTIDFHSDLSKRGFVFNNPSSKSTCGCGSSFSV